MEDLGTWLVEVHGLTSGEAALLVRVQRAALAFWLAQPDRGGALLRWLAESLDRPRDGSDSPDRSAFGKALGLASAADWERTEAAFAAWFPSAWLALDPATLGPKPPPLADWPGYREAE